ncbi:hypothetical protein F4680DRAFT_464132 [Xylaria scruposa]|nr:hypothetical protein F4680DRAFT_464132 [Xylaria scruposa]
MVPSTDPAHWAKFVHLKTAKVAQSSNEGSSDTMAFPILRLPPEVLLGVFCELGTQPSVVNLARAHPIFYTIFKENRRSIEKAIMNDFLACLAKGMFRYKSPYLMKICLMKRQIQYNDIRKSYEDLSAVLSHRWIASPEDQLLAYYDIDELPIFCILVGELEFLGYFAQESNPNRWYKRRFFPVARWACNRRDQKFGAFTYKTQPRFENIELLLIIELWCIMRIKYGSAAMSISTFRSIFTPEIAEKTKQFARRHIEVCKSPMAWSWLSGRHRLSAFIFCIEAFSAVAELASFAEDECRIHRGMVAQSFNSASSFMHYEQTPYHLTRRIEHAEIDDILQYLYTEGELVIVDM